MKYFSEEFLEGLATKSQGFQEKFASIMSDIDYFFDEEEEIEDFRKYFESEISYAEPGNMLYSAKVIFGHGVAEEEDRLPLGQEIIQWFFKQFAVDDDAFEDASHFFIAIRCKKEDFTDEDEFLLRTLISMKRQGDEPEVVMILNEQKDDIYATCFMAAMR